MTGLQGKTLHTNPRSIVTGGNTRSSGREVVSTSVKPGCDKSRP